MLIILYTLFFLFSFTREIRVAFFHLPSYVYAFVSNPPDTFIQVRSFSCKVLLLCNCISNLLTNNYHLLTLHWMVMEYTGIARWYNWCRTISKYRDRWQKVGANIIRSFSDVEKPFLFSDLAALMSLKPPNQKMKKAKARIRANTVHGQNVWPGSVTVHT